jgi:hypothetical protein
MKKLVGILSIAIIIPYLQSCKKVEGEGGGATIKGTLYEQRKNGFGTVIAEYPAMDERVYIIYGGENTFPDDDVRASYDGSFEFRYLLKGKYKIFVYSDCSTCPSGSEALIKEIEITDKKQVIDLDTLFRVNL